MSLSRWSEYSFALTSYGSTRSNLHILSRSAESNSRPRFTKPLLFHWARAAKLFRQFCRNPDRKRREAASALMSAIRELNPCLILGKDTLSHSTNPALQCLLYQSQSKEACF